MTENLIPIVYDLVKKLAVPVSKTAIVDELRRMPNDNNLFVISELLDKWNIRNGAYQLPAEELGNEHCPFIAHIRSGKKKLDFALITEFTDTGVKLLGPADVSRKPTRAQFAQMYAGTALLVEATEESGEKDYAQNRKKERAGTVGYFIAAGLILLLFAGFFVNSQPVVPWLSALLMVKLCGIGLSGALVSVSLRGSNFYTDKLCFKGKHADCDEVIGSAAGNLFAWLTWAEVGLFYFAGTLLAFLLAGDVKGAFSLAALFNLLALPYVVFSIGYQAFYLKKWCVMCCLVQLCLVTEFVIAFNSGYFSIYLPAAATVISFAVAMLIVPAIWLFVKPLIIDAGQLAPTIEALAQFKYNKDLFNEMLSRQPRYVTPNANDAIVMGSADADRMITLVSNPYCGPCANTHNLIEEWLETDKDVQVRLVFTQSSGEIEVNKHILALYRTCKPEAFRNALNDWYRQDVKDYAIWSAKYPVNKEAPDALQMVDAQEKWCEAAEVNFTPLILVNGHALPGAYKVPDLKYLI